MEREFKHSPMLRWRTSPRYTLRFLDGSVLSGFEWSLMGWYFRYFPESGIRSEQINNIKFTKEAIEEAGIIVEVE